MAVFEILSCTPLQPERAEFTVALREGLVIAGDSFACYDTHHRIIFHVLGVAQSPTELQLLCSGSVGFNGQFVGAIVDTSAKEQHVAFHFAHAAS